MSACSHTVPLYAIYAIFTMHTAPMCLNVLGHVWCVHMGGSEVYGVYGVCTWRASTKRAHMINVYMFVHIQTLIHTYTHTHTHTHTYQVKEIARREALQHAHVLLVNVGQVDACPLTQLLQGLRCGVCVCVCVCVCVSGARRRIPNTTPAELAHPTHTLHHHRHDTNGAYTYAYFQKYTLLFSHRHLPQCRQRERERERPGAANDWPRP